jgi:POT family proton-dependent oligopeptide transporter
MQNIDILNKAPNTKTFLGHPVGLFLLFATEMWERLSYYGMRSIMVLYLAAPATIAAMGWGSLTEDQAQQNALTYWGWFGFFVYIAPVIGGWIADRITGQRLAILIGGLLMAFGKFIMAIPFVIVGNLAYECLLIGMAMNIIGNGLFKPNISTLVSDLYEPNDKRQESAFTIFY